MGVVAWLGCGGGNQGGASARRIDPAEVAVRPPPPDACAETAAILDGTPALATELGLDAEPQERASAEYVALVTEACRSHGWPAVVIDCVRNAAGKDELGSCIEQLPSAAEKAFTKLVAGWRAELVAATERARPAPVACDGVVRDAAAWFVRPPGDDLAALAGRLYSLEVARTCEAHAWPAPARACLAGAGGADELARCRALLAAGAVEALDGSRERSAARLDAITASLAKPRQLECGKIVDRFYGLAGWADVLPRLSGRARTKAFAGAEKRMAAACKKARWAPSARACLLTAATPPDARGCLDAHGDGGFDWDLAPADAATTGVAPCDAYLDELERKHAACKPEDPSAPAREVAERRAALLSAPAGEDLAATCTAAAEQLAAEGVPCGR
jgi:hypothetical protein